ncbi:TPA: hypothetical protein IHM15_004547, partial [Escherichia coli]|nr:hypothetical protein [Escherichia coli]
MSEKCSRIAVWCFALLCVAVAHGALASNSSHSLEAAQSAQSVLIRKMGDAQSYKEFPRFSTPEAAELLDSVWGIEPPELRDHKLQEIREFCVVGKVILKSYLNFMDQSGGINQATNIKEFTSEIQKGANFALNCLATYAEAEGGKGAVIEDNSSGGEAAGWFTSGEDGATQLLVSCVD